MSFELDRHGRERSDNVERVSLAGEVCIFHAAELKPQLFALLEQGGALVVDASQVSEIDTAGVQLLLALKRESLSLGCQLSIVNHSDALLDMLELLNLGRDFGDPLVLTAEREQETARCES